MKITKIYRSDKDKSGKPYINKKGNPYTRIGIQVDSKEYKDQWLSGFSSAWNSNWKEGDEIDVNVEKVEKDGKVYFNFSRIDPIDELEVRVAKLENYVFGGGKEPVDADPQENGDLPF